MAESSSKRRLLFAVALLGAGCAMETGPRGNDEPVAGSADRLTDGTVTNADPEVGLLNVPSGNFPGSCTATLISSHWFITAAHCFAYGNAPNSATLTIAGTAYNVTDVISIDAENAALGGMDVAIGKLGSDVPGSTATPAALSPTPPASGDAVVVLGYGCTNRDTKAGAGVKRYTEFTWGSSNRLCFGDSGGPVRRGMLNDGGPIVAINSTSGDVFAIPFALSERIEATMRAYDAVEINMDRPGFDYTSFNIPNSFGLGVLSCKKSCEEDPECRAFSYVTSNGTCFLKTGAQRATPKWGVHSGLPSASDSFDVPGNDYKSQLLLTLDMCVQACATDPACNAYTYVNGTCFFKNVVPAPSSSCSGCTSGIKHGLMVGFDLPGSDLSHFDGVGDPISCAGACADNPDCLAFTYKGSTQKCYLKNGSPVPSINIDTTSGVRRGFEINLDRAGSDYKDFFISTPRPQQCQAQCEQESQCQAWTYVPPVPNLTTSLRNDPLNNPLLTQAHCFLKSSIPASSSKLGIISGVKGLAFF